MAEAGNNLKFLQIICEAIWILNSTNCWSKFFEFDSRVQVINNEFLQRLVLRDLVVKRVQFLFYHKPNLKIKILKFHL